MSVKEPPIVRERGTCCELPEVDAGWANATAEILKALADPTRLTMIAALWRANEPVCICDFTASLDLGQPTISHHMAKLRAAGLVVSAKRGIWVYYQLRPDLPASARSLLAQLVG